MLEIRSGYHRVDFYRIYIFEQLAHVAEIEVEIFHKEEAGALCVVMRENSVIHAIIEYFWNMMSGVLTVFTISVLKVPEDNDIEKRTDELLI